MRPSMKEMEKDTGKWDKAQLAKCSNLDVQKKGGKKEIFVNCKTKSSKSFHSANFVQIT